MKSHLIVTGSYLGKVANDKDFFLPAGDLYRLRMDSLSFEEFLRISGRRKMYESLDLYGSSPKEEYNEISKAFSVYKVIGGYLEVIKTYLAKGGIREIELSIDHILEIFADESTRYFDSIADKTIYRFLFLSIADLLLREKKGADDLVEELFKLCEKEGTSRISKRDVQHAISWLYQLKVLGFCGKCIDCDYSQLKFNNRFYFTDMGVAHRFLAPLAKNTGTLNGALAENFAYLQLRDMIVEQGLAPEVPAFGVYGSGEVDFVVCNPLGGTSYVVEVKSGRDSSNTVNSLLQKKKIDYALFAKGDTYGGKAGNMLTIPLYLLRRFLFEDFTKKSVVPLDIIEVPEGKWFG